MNILVACDSFKGALSSECCNQAITKGLKGHQVYTYPIADGGEGSLKALLSQPGWVEKSVMAHNLRGEMIKAHYAVYQEVAAVEVAELLGIQWVDEYYTPENTSSYGLGECVRYIAENETVQYIILMLGGTGIVDGGIGFGEAIGIRYQDEQHRYITQVTGKDLERIAFIDEQDKMDFSNIQFWAGCDVQAPLTGKDGAVCLFGAQKGIQNLKEYEKWMQHYRKICDVSEQPGDGAAGGLGFFMRVFLGAQFKSGFDMIVQAQHWNQILPDIDCVLTGEGKMDAQSLLGKLPFKVAQYTDKPTIALVGQSDVSPLEIQKSPLTAVFPIVQFPCSLEEAMKHTEEWLYKTTKQVIQVIEECENGVN